MEKEIWAYSIKGLESLMAELGQPRFRAKQLLEWLYGKGVSTYDEMTNLPQMLREELQRSHPLIPPTMIDKQTSQDGTCKYIFEYPDANRVETVAIPSLYEPLPPIFDGSPTARLAKVPPAPDSSQKDRKRLTICLSTQIGCGMGCSFCATGKEGFTRNLFPGEIVGQIIAVQKDLGRRVSNLVTMGQGEPFLNYENTLSALRIANNPDCLAIGARHITISTCGIIDGILRLAEEPEQFTLAVSLHSALQDTRNQIMPRVASSSLSELKKALQTYGEKTNRRITLEYIMIDKLNDTPSSFDALVDFCSGLLCHINLLPINPIHGLTTNPFPMNPDSQKASSREPIPMKPSPRSKIAAWTAGLERMHIPVTVRNSRGSDIAGACGQLKNSL